jgi:hypothetical protein
VDDSIGFGFEEPFDSGVEITHVGFGAFDLEFDPLESVWGAHGT